jgi:serum/glucocorticoid-regulated kinase 2
MQYSESLIKINKSDAYQTRFILITDYGIYNIKKKEIRRFIAIDRIEGVTISYYSNEFVIHEKDTYDIRYETENRELLLKHLIYVCQVLRQ